MSGKHERPGNRKTGESVSLSTVRPRTIRLDDATWAAAEEYARRRGLNSAAEYIRQSVIILIAWDRAMEAFRMGGTVADLHDVELLGRMLDKITDEQAEAGQASDLTRKQQRS